jgi:methyl-accepting chemotaxis protein
VNKKTFITPLSSHNAHNQAKIAVVLISIVPSLSLFYLGAMMWSKTERLPLYVAIIILACIIVVAVSGYLILQKYPENIIKLRQYTEEIAAGVLPDKVSLLNTQSSDDLMFIENGFNTILQEMRRRIELVEQKLDVEQALRKIIERQQEDLVQAERHRAMIQSLGAACHHIGQPATILKLRLYLIKQLAGSDDEVTAIRECEREIHLIMSVLDKLRSVNEFRTEPYVGDANYADSRILSI